MQGNNRNNMPTTYDFTEVGVSKVVWPDEHHPYFQLPKHIDSVTGLYYSEDYYPLTEEEFHNSCFLALKTTLDYHYDNVCNHRNIKYLRRYFNFVFKYCPPKHLWLSKDAKFTNTIRHFPREGRRVLEDLRLQHGIVLSIQKDHSCE